MGHIDRLIFIWSGFVIGISLVWSSNWPCMWYFASLVRERCYFL